jgi:hypothetical protein
MQRIYNFHNQEKGTQEFKGWVLCKLRNFSTISFKYFPIILS